MKNKFINRIVNNIRLEKKIDIYVKNKNNMQSNSLIYVICSHVRVYYLNKLIN